MRSRHLYQPSILGAGPAFGSLHVENGLSLLPVAVKHVDERLRQKILLFDWWIQNEDRILGETGGHLSVIDHNNAFDSNFNKSSFFRDLVFREERMNRHKGRSYTFCITLRRNP